MSNTRERTLKILQSNAKKDGTILRGSIRDMITDLMHICLGEGLDIEDMMDSARDVFEEEAEKCGQFCHDDANGGLTICEEVSGTEHSHHDGEHKCRKATSEEENKCRRLWNENGVNAVVHLVDGKVIDLNKN